MSIDKTKQRIKVTLERLMVAKLTRLAKRERRTISAVLEIAVERLFVDAALTRLLPRATDYPDSPKRAVARMRTTLEQSKERK